MFTRREFPGTAGAASAPLADVDDSVRVRDFQCEQDEEPMRLRSERNSGKLRVQARVPSYAAATLLLPGGRRAPGSGDHEFTGGTA